MIDQCLINLDLFDSSKVFFWSGTSNDLPPSFLRETKEDQSPFNALQTASVKRVGIDIVSISRMAQLIKRYDRHTLTLLFTQGEIDRCQTSYDCDRAFSVCFATKEAVGKALGTGLVDIEWTEIEAIFTLDELVIKLYGKANMQAKRNEIQRWLASWHEWDEHILVQTLAL